MDVGSFRPLLVVVRRNSPIWVYEQQLRRPEVPVPEHALHDWFIEQREYDRQESRRGRRHAYGSLDPRRTALVVVDRG
jgi:hypothetical protein